MESLFNKLANTILSNKVVEKIIPPRNVSILRYFVKFKCLPNLENPKNLNEKLLWLEFNTDTTKWTELSDKYLVRRYVEEKGLGNILVNLYGVYNEAKEIDFSALPQSFVIKTNNGYGTVILVRDKSQLREKELKETLDKWLKEPFGYVTGEPHYTRIKPCIIIEELLEKPSNQKSLIDYKFWCLNGKPYCCFVCTNRDPKSHHAEFCYYEIPSWNRRIDMMAPQFYNETIVPKPSRLDDMLRYAEILADDFPLVRVDMYEVNGKVYFGEMTFTSNGGRMTYFTKEALLLMGNNLKLDI